ncbi:MAG: hypothetical protein GQ525_14180 [Draconibacterium sp.]|nr:hypothetical protein [Draconibacterium sp.]
MLNYIPVNLKGFIVHWLAVIKPNSKSDVMIHYTDVPPAFMEIAGGTAHINIDRSNFLSALKEMKKKYMDMFIVYNQS